MNFLEWPGGDFVAQTTKYTTQSQMEKCLPGRASDYINQKPGKEI